MKRLIIFFLCLVGILLPCIAYADSTTQSAITKDYTEPIIIEIEKDSGEQRLVNVEQSLMKVSANDTNGLKSLLLEIIGDYETVTTDYTYQSGSSGYYSHSISIERDWAWIMTCALWIVITFCMFRILGGILCR